MKSISDIEMSEISLNSLANFLMVFSCLANGLLSSLVSVVTSVVICEVVSFVVVSVSLIYN